MKPNTKWWRILSTSTRGKILKCTWGDWKRTTTTNWTSPKLPTMSSLTTHLSLSRANQVKLLLSNLQRKSWRNPKRKTILTERMRSTWRDNSLIPLHGIPTSNLLPIQWQTTCTKSKLQCKVWIRLRSSLQLDPSKVLILIISDGN